MICPYLVKKIPRADKEYLTVFMAILDLYYNVEQIYKLRMK